METKELEKEFLTMIEAQKRTIYKVCYIYANDQEDLNDLFQETVLNLWKSFPRYRGDSTLNTWVYRIAMNTCITFLRRSNIRPQTVPMTANVASMAAENNETAGNSLPPTRGNRNHIQNKPKRNMRQMAISTAMMMALMPLRILDWLMNLVCNLMAAVIETVLSIILSWVAIILTILLLIGTFLWIVSL